MTKKMRPFIKMVSAGLTSFVAVGAAVLCSWSLMHAQRDRAPASIESTLSKEQILLGGSMKHLPIHGKGHGLVEIDIQAPGKGWVRAGTAINLEATVEARENLQDMKYIWILPKDGVSVLSGPLEGDLGALAEGQKTTIRISVSSQTSLNRQIHLHVYHVVNGENMGQMAQYNTVDQETIEAKASSRAEELRASGVHRKIIQ